MLLCSLVSPLALAQDWKPVGDRLMTEWASLVDPEKPLPDYPRPQMVRQLWGNLNGLWDYAITGKDGAQPTTWDGKILVPFAIESALSGVGKAVSSEQKLWYRTPVFVPKTWRGDDLHIRFGAVDWHAMVWLNGKPVGEHKGGYTPFSCFVSNALVDGEEQELVVSVWDPTDDGFQPRGKQVNEPKGIWYTSVTGIWQTVWLEPVPKVHITSIKLVPDIDAGKIYVNVSYTGNVARVKVEVMDGRSTVSTATSEGEELDLAIADPKLWSPDLPHLYAVRVSLEDENGGVIDSVQSYCGMRKIAFTKDDKGVNRLFLNNKPIFMYGPLDQGWWPDGLYTAPTDAALKSDIQLTKQLGFNMARKHVKVEPARWYFWCDVLGLLVWQDLPNGDRHIKRDQEDIIRTPESESNYRREYEEMISLLQNHPSIAVWVPFNEGWGQFKTDEILAWAKELDPTRLVDGPSGWTDRGSGDMIDIHSYPGPATPELEDKRVAVLGEFGGLGLPVKNHLWWDKRNWGYRTYQTRDELWVNYRRLMRKLYPMIGSGLGAAIYTQTTDVEGEVNGLITYDRKRVKFDIDAMRALNEQVYGPQPTFERTVVVPAARDQEETLTWSYTMEKPADDWAAVEFDVSAWKTGIGGFGSEGTPGARVETEWTTDELWIRRNFTLDALDYSELNYHIHYDENATVFINGQQVDAFKGYTNEYEDIPVSSAALEALKLGDNVIAVHCTQTEGGQYIDLGLVDLKINE